MTRIPSGPALVWRVMSRGASISVLGLVLTLGLSAAHPGLASAQDAAPAPTSPPSPTLPDDPRLGSARAELEALVASLVAAGLPAELVVTKTREGLAKKIPVARILVAARKLGADLAEVDVLARAGLGLRGTERVPPGLLAALTDARAAGAPARELEGLLVKSAGKGAASTATRAAVALADLAVRGYPTKGTGGLLGGMARSDASGRKLLRLTAALETLRNAEGLSAAQALDAVRDALVSGADPDSAVKKVTAARSRGKSTAPGQNKLKIKGKSGK